MPAGQVWQAIHHTVCGDTHLPPTPPPGDNTSLVIADKVTRVIHNLKQVGVDDNISVFWQGNNIYNALREWCLGQ